MTTVSLSVWSSMVERWNALSATQRTATAADCRSRGHDPAMSPVGPFCRRCLMQFHGDPPETFVLGAMNVSDSPSTLAAQRKYRARKRAELMANVAAHEAHKAQERGRIRELRQQQRRNALPRPAPGARGG